MEEQTKIGGPKLQVSAGEDNMVELIIGGDISSPYKDILKKWAEETHEAVKETKRKTGKKVLILADISKLTQFDSESFEALRDLINLDRLDVEKIATFGGSFFSIMSQNSLATVTENKNLRAFENKYDAIKWLKERDGA